MDRFTYGTERRGRGALRATALLTLLTALLVAPGTAGAAAPGGFNQLAGPLGCIQVSAPATCRTAFGLNGPYKLAVSPDGKNVYQAAYSGKFTIYDRDVNTGALTQKPGAAGCIQNGAATPGTCAGATAFASSNDVAVSPDGKTVWVVASGSDAVAVFTRNTSNGTLTQKAGLDGCVANADAACRDAEAMDFPYDLTVSPDGKSVYVASFSSASVTALVAASDGVLSQPAAQDGFFGCVTEAAAGTCQDGRALSNAIAVAATSDGKNVYASTQSASVVALERNSTGRIRMETSPNACASKTGAGPCATVAELQTNRAIATSPDAKRVFVADQSGSTVVALDRQADGGIIRHAGTSGCVSNGVNAACTTGRGLAAVQGLAPSSDGLHLYANSNGAVVELKVSSGGGLSPRADKRGCVQLAAATSDCQQGVAISNGFGIALSPNGRSIYAAEQNTNAITVYKRDSATPVCQSAGVAITAGESVRLTLPCSDADGDALTRTLGDPPALGNLGPIDQGTGQVTFASSGVPGSASFQFHSTSNGINSNSAQFTITVNAAGGGGGGGGGPSGGGGGGTTPLTILPSTTSISSLGFKKFTKLVNLSVKNLVAGSTVTVTCKTKKKSQQKKGCAYKKKRFTTSGARAKLNLRKPFAKKRVPVGAKITITIAAPGFIGKQIQYTVRAAKIPKSRVRCIPPGGKAGSCA